MQQRKAIIPHAPRAPGTPGAVRTRKQTANAKKANQLFAILSNMKANA